MQQSFKQVFVTNNPALLAQGQTVDKLAVGQIGIIDAKTYTGVTSPTYATVKGLQFVLGRPDLGDLGIHSGVPNSDIFSKLVKGKLIKNFRGKKAAKGKNQVLTIGYSGDVSDTNTLFAKKGEEKHLFLTLTGAAIDKLFTKQGVTRKYVYGSTLASDCEDSCASVNPIDIAESLVLQINGDKQINRFVKASVIKECDPDLTALPSQTIYKFKLIVADAGDDTSLGLVQTQYATEGVKRISRQDIYSTYEIQKTANTVPTAFTNAGNIVIPDCNVAPSGYTLITGGFVYTIKRSDAGTSGATTTLNTDYGITGNNEFSTRLAYEFGQSTYVVVSQTALTASGSDVLVLQGSNRSYAVLTTPTTITWLANGTLVKYGKTFKIRLGDTVCGSNRLSELQSFYDNNVVTIVDAAGTCVHTYETTVYSNVVELGCSQDQISFLRPQAFDGVNWVEDPNPQPANGAICKAGIKLIVSVVNRKTNECTFDYFPYEADGVYATASTFDPNYNNHPSEAQWAVQQLQSVSFPRGVGAYIQRLEKQSLSYNLLERSYNPVVRENEGYEFNAKDGVLYDEYVIDFGFKYVVGGWTQEYNDNYSLHFFFPEGQGKAFEAAINAYLASANIALDPVVL